MMKKKHTIAGIALTVMGLMLVGVGAFSFQIASANSLVSQTSNWGILLIGGGVILVISGIVAIIWLYHD